MNGIDLIARELVRQVEEEKYTTEHDAGHSEELALAAACYAAATAKTIPLAHTVSAAGHEFTDIWPWDDHFDKRKKAANHVNHLPVSRTEKLDLLIKAGALIAAAIDALE